MRKGVSTSIIKSNIDLLHKLPDADLYELGFFNAEDLDRIKSFINQKNTSFGIHCPFVYRFPRHPHLTSMDNAKRKKTMEIIEKCAILSKDLKAEYIVVHFPDSYQNENWLMLLDYIKSFLSHINHIIPVRIENVYFNKYFHSYRDYLRFFEDTEFTFCVDIGHLLMDAEYFRFNPLEFIKKTKNFISEFHIYYADIRSYKKCHHKPWKEDENFLRILNFIKSFDCDMVIEPTPYCNEGLDKLLIYWRNL